jgi:2-haloacid dehalogenase
MRKAAVFDVGQVLFGWRLGALFEKLIADPAERDWFLANVVTEEWHFQHDHGRSPDETIPERAAQFPHYAEHLHAFRARFDETITGPIAGVHALVRRLHARGVPLFCLTNFGDEFFAAFRPAQPIFDLFADIVVSGVEKVAKPDARIYAIVEERSGRSGAELFFTDDNPANIAAARARGWDAHQFTDAASLESQLVAAGLL